VRAVDSRTHARTRARTHSTLQSHAVCAHRNHPKQHTNTHKHTQTQSATKGVGGAREPDPVEYDLDNEDEDWLAGYNLGRSKLNDLLFEKMLHRLELACAAATENALSAAGAPACGAQGLSRRRGCGVERRRTAPRRALPQPTMLLRRCRCCGWSCAGAGATERMSAGAVAAIDHLPKQDAIRMLALECGGR
jgi:hypothetical protein